MKILIIFILFLEIFRLTCQNLVLNFTNLTQLFKSYQNDLIKLNQSIFSYKNQTCPPEVTIIYYGNLTNDPLNNLKACKNLNYDFSQDIQVYNTTISTICNRLGMVSYNSSTRYVYCSGSASNYGYFYLFDKITYDKLINEIAPSLDHYLLTNYTNDNISNNTEFFQLLQFASIIFPFTQYADTINKTIMMNYSYNINQVLLFANVDKTSIRIVQMVKNFLNLVLDNFGTSIDYTRYILKYLTDIPNENVYGKTTQYVYVTNNSADIYLNFTSGPNISSRILDTIITNISYDYTNSTPFVFIPKEITRALSTSFVKYVLIYIMDPRIYINESTPPLKSQLVLVKALDIFNNDLPWPNSFMAIRIIIPWAFSPLTMKLGRSFVNNCMINMYYEDSNSWGQVFGIIDPNSNNYYVAIYVNNFGLYAVSCINNERYTYLINNAHNIYLSFYLILIILILI